jgi:hypothetical protein
MSQRVGPKIVSVMLTVTKKESLESPKFTSWVGAGNSSTTAPLWTGECGVDCRVGVNLNLEYSRSRTCTSFSKCTLNLKLCDKLLIHGNNCKHLFFIRSSCRFIHKNKYFLNNKSKVHRPACFSNRIFILKMLTQRIYCSITSCSKR